ncbi:hypothetical protein [Sphingomonas sp. KR3-1]|uniref:hypothetical protein n=1 Tax=Sphingomonas sp. KR3-1 TaxID=3156611 RepID=UPI0032B5046E
MRKLGSFAFPCNFAALYIKQALGNYDLHRAPVRDTHVEIVVPDLPNTLQLRSASDLIAEIRATITSRHAKAIASIHGEQFFIDVRKGATGKDFDLGVQWILHAQAGTLDKLEHLLTRDGVYEIFELLAIARNLFENLIWLRLFNIDSRYGVVFYREFLDQHKNDLEQLIAKMAAEAELFDEFAALDSANTHAAFEDAIKEKPRSDASMKAASERHRQLADALDAKARRGFALFAAAAKVNSYGWQAHLIRTKAIPDRQEMLDLVLGHIADLENRELRDAAAGIAALPRKRWNWREQAERVGMVDQYDYLYRFTSRLLHATPMNIITEKTLVEGEDIMLLEYIFVSVSDLLDEIERFDFPDSSNAIAVTL